MKYLIIIFIFSSCFTSTYSPTRPAKVPETAVWKGGVDGGYWFNLVSVKAKRNFHFIIYNDFTGEVVEDDFFHLSENCNAKSYDSIQILNSISDYDGRFIFLMEVVDNKYCSLMK